MSDLFLHGLEKNVPSIQLHEYTADDVNKVNKSIPNVEPIVGTLKLDEIFVQTENDTVNVLVKDDSSQKGRPITLKTLSDKKLHKHVESESDDSSVDEYRYISRSIY